MLNFSTDKRT